MGIQAAKDVKLSNRARTLKEDQPLIQTEDRLSRNLNDVDFVEVLNDEICRRAAPKVCASSVGKNVLSSEKHCFSATRIKMGRRKKDGPIQCGFGEASLLSPYAL